MNNEFAHYGVKGMKWGVRKDRKSSNKMKKQPNYKTMSDEELKSKINRLNLEKQYKKLDYEMNASARTKFAKRIGKQFIDRAIVEVTIGAAAAVARPYVEKLMKKAAQRMTNQGISHSDEFAHYGVKGMKWGVRKEYIPHPRKAAKKIAAKTKSALTKAKNYDYKRAAKTVVNRKDLSDEEAKRIYDRNKKIALGLLGAAAATAVGIAGYHAYRVYGKEFLGTTIRAGKKFQRITRSPNERTGPRMYASFGKRDKTLYKGLLGSAYANTAKVYSRSFAFNKAIKAPSMREARKVFDDIVANDRSAVALMNELKGLTGGKVNGKNASDYELFNTYGPLQNSQQWGAVMNKFYSTLSSKGYNAVVDVNDIKFSGFKANAPMIIFDTRGLVDNAVSELTSGEIKKNMDKALNAEIMEKIVPTMLLSGGATAYAVNEHANDSRKEKTKDKKESSKPKGVKKSG